MNIFIKLIFPVTWTEHVVLFVGAASSRGRLILRLKAAHTGNCGGLDFPDKPPLINTGGIHAAGQWKAMVILL